MSLFEKIGP